MPHLRFRSLTKEQTQTLSQNLLEELASAIQTSKDNFTFELIETNYFYGGEAVPSYPFVEVLWFERPQEIQDSVAKLITKKVKQVTSESEDVVVVFQKLEKTNYYENGTHF